MEADLEKTGLQLQAPAQSQPTHPAVHVPANLQDPRLAVACEPTALMHVAGGISPMNSRARTLASQASQGATLLHPGHPGHPGHGVISPALLYPGMASSWHRELEDRKWRANAEHILKIEHLVSTACFHVGYSLYSLKGDDMGDYRRYYSRAS